jgi:hypothetical protein
MTNRPARNARALLCLVTLVAILLANDFFLKATFHNDLTGKLSDFAGLAALALFVQLLLPRLAAGAFLGIACAFIWWKSMLSASFIEFANGVLPFSIGRTVDPSYSKIP